jgi:hypothetical protein
VCVFLSLLWISQVTPGRTRTRRQDTRPRATLRRSRATHRSRDTHLSRGTRSRATRRRPTRSRRRSSSGRRAAGPPSWRDGTYTPPPPLSVPSLSCAPSPAGRSPTCSTIRVRRLETPVETFAGDGASDPPAALAGGELIVWRRRRRMLGRSWPAPIGERLGGTWTWWRARLPRAREVS